MSEPHTCNVDVSEPHTRSVAVSEPHTRNVDVSKPHTRSIAVSDPQTCNVDVSEPHTRNVDVSEPHTRNVDVSESEPIALRWECSFKDIAPELNRANKFWIHFSFCLTRYRLGTCCVPASIICIFIFMRRHQ